MAATLALGVLLTLITAGMLAYAGVLVRRRPATGDARLALDLYATWWFAAALVIVLAASHTMLGLVGVTDGALHTALTYLVDIPLAVALWALLYYLVYIFTGKRAALGPLSVAYAFFLAFLFVYAASAGPRHLETTAWSMRSVGETTPPAWMSAAFGVLLAAPVLFIVVAYGALLRRVKPSPQRRRLALTAIAFGVWFTPVLAGFLLGWQSQEWFPLVYEVPGVLAALLVVTAHRSVTPASSA
jgi:hypothetical protein